MNDVSYLDFAPSDPGTCFSCGLSLWSAPQPGCSGEHGSVVVEKALTDRVALMTEVIGDQITSLMTDATVGWSMTAVTGEDRKASTTFVPIADLRAVPFMDLLVSPTYVPERLRVYTGPTVDGLQMDIWHREDSAPDLLFYAPISSI